MTELATLLTSEGEPFATGAARYYDMPAPGAPAEPRIYIRIEPGGIGVEVTAMVDTGAPWCILEPKVAAVVQDHLEEYPGRVVLDSRLGRYSGSLFRGAVKLTADKGKDLDLDTTLFISPDWPGGNFVGYMGFLERIRFAFDPQANMFHFGP